MWHTVSLCLPLPHVCVCACMRTCLSVSLSLFPSFSPWLWESVFIFFSKHLVEISGGSLCTKYPFLAGDDLPHLDGVPLDFCHLLHVCRVSILPHAGYLRPFLFLSCESFCRLVKANDIYRESALWFALMLLWHTDGLEIAAFKYLSMFPLSFSYWWLFPVWLENIFGMASVLISVWWLFHSLGMVYFGICPTGLEDNLREATVQWSAP